MGMGERISDRYLSGWTRYLQKTDVHVRYPVIKPSLDNERFYATHTFYSFDDFAKQQKAYNRRDYNNFPMWPLGWKTPDEVWNWDGKIYLPSQFQQPVI